MSQQDPRFLSNLPHRVREQIEAFPERVQGWRAAFREDPAAFFRLPVTRYAGLFILLLLAGGALVWLSNAFTPSAGPGNFEEATATATLFVACTNPDCLATAVSRQPRDFNRWPLTCDKCKQPTVYRASRCPACGQWFATAPGRATACPHCAKAAQAKDAPKPKTDKPKDTEDWW